MTPPAQCGPLRDHDASGGGMETLQHRVRQKRTALVLIRFALLRYQQQIGLEHNKSFQRPSATRAPLEMPSSSAALLTPTVANRTPIGLSRRHPAATAPGTRLRSEPVAGLRQCRIEPCRPLEPENGSSRRNFVVSCCFDGGFRQSQDVANPGLFRTSQGLYGGLYRRWACAVTSQASIQAAKGFATPALAGAARAKPSAVAAGPRSHCSMRLVQPSGFGPGCRSPARQRPLRSEGLAGAIPAINLAVHA